MEQERIREWNLAYILDHWLRVGAMVVLIFTGLYIQWPFIKGGPDSFIMAWMRFFHFVAAYVFVLGLVVRVYLAFRSTFDADWKDFSVTQAIKNIPDIAGYYLFFKGMHKDYRKYNPLQALSYLFTGGMIIFSALTGFAIYHGNVFGIIPAPAAFRWVNTLLGGESYTRMWHIITMWYFIIFLMVHVYMSIMITLVNKDGTLTSIVTGYKLKNTTLISEEQIPGDGYTPPRKVLILGVGNLLLTDDGFGVHVINALKNAELPENINLLEAGTVSHQLIPLFHAFDLLIVIDTVEAGDTPGSLFRFSPDDMQFTSEHMVSLHQLSLIDILQMAELTGGKPETIIIAVQPKDVSSCSLELSDEVKAAIPKAMELVIDELKKAGAL